MPDLHAIAHDLGHTPSGRACHVSGGCIHETFLWGDWFIKTDSPHHADQFRTEAEGLTALAATHTFRVPGVIGHGVTRDSAYLVLEALDLTTTGDEAVFGEQLAALHEVVSEHYGFTCDNYIGATPQPNPPTISWPDFFQNQRLAHMIRLVEQKRAPFPDATAFLEKLPSLLPERPPASLLHGDLWGGNKAFLAEGTPVIFDPAAYYGDAECDLAMTHLFGGFSTRFYEAYRSHRPAPENEQQLHEIYNLYHILNHALLFGGGYHSEARDIMRRYA